MIEESKSNYASPIVLVKKKNGTLRLCVDYRKLNKKTIRDCYPLPRIDDILDILGGSKWFLCIDLKAAYNQIPVKGIDRHKTACTSPLGLYQFVKIPFGLSNAPATFQRIMNGLFREEILQGVICYLNDIIIYSKSEKEHFELLSKVFSKLSFMKLMINEDKCLFFQKKWNC